MNSSNPIQGNTRGQIYSLLVFNGTKHFLATQLRKNSVRASTCRQWAKVWFPERWLNIKLSVGIPVLSSLEYSEKEWVARMQSSPKSQIFQSVLIPLTSVVYICSGSVWCSGPTSEYVTFLFFILDPQTFVMKLRLDNGSPRKINPLSSIRNS